MRDLISFIIAFTKALTCLSRYGEELSIFATTEFLSFSATNAAKSAYCRFKYDKQFFSKFKLNAPKTEGFANNDHHVSGQLLAKVGDESKNLIISSDIAADIAIDFEAQDSRKVRREV